MSINSTQINAITLYETHASCGGNIFNDNPVNRWFIGDYMMVVCFVLNDGNYELLFINYTTNVIVYRELVNAIPDTVWHLGKYWRLRFGNMQLIYRFDSDDEVSHIANVFTSDESPKNIIAICVDNADPKYKTEVLARGIDTKTYVGKWDSPI